MFKYSNVELKNSKVKLLHYVSNDNLMKYLMDDNEITLLVNLFKTEMIILSIPVFKDDRFHFRRLLLLTEEDSGDSFLIYNEDLLIFDVFAKFVASKHRVRNVKEKVFFIGVNAYLDFVNFLKFRFEEIEGQVVNEKFVASNIINLMLYDTILQKASPNLEGIGMLVEETSKKLGLEDVELANSLISLKVEIVQIRGLVRGLSDLSDNISHSIDSINNYRLNIVMRTLTILTVCLAIPTLFAGLYGMNVPLPYQDYPFIMFGIFALSMAIIVGVLYVFKRRRYF
ncbi:MAG: CorA family divalent cation transporter [Firmicutes bacterium]|nr:CorA family divalent cation transporter [Bacillota bacterium]